MKNFLGNKRNLISVAVIVLIAIGLVYWLMSKSGGFMPADVNSSNGSHYAVEIPDAMEPARINENASLEYQDENRQLYTVIIDESKAKIISFGLDYDLETYMKIAARTLDSTGLYLNKPATINTYNALQTEIKATVKGKSMIYKLTCIETPKFFYQVLTSTPEDHFESNKDDMEKIVASFKEVDK